MTSIKTSEKRVQQAAMRAAEMVEAAAPECMILASLASAGEALAGDGAVSSILVLDEEGLLRNGASPNLPADYILAIDRLKPHPSVGTCSAAAATGEVVMTPDFLADNKWGELRHLPLALGFVGAWSMPIKSLEGKVLGTFGTYYRISHTPTLEEVAGVQKLADAAASVLAKSRPDPTPRLCGDHFPAVR